MNVNVVTKPTISHQNKLIKQLLVKTNLKNKIKSPLFLSPSSTLRLKDLVPVFYQEGRYQGDPVTLGVGGFGRVALVSCAFCLGLKTHKTYVYIYIYMYFYHLLER